MTLRIEAGESVIGSDARQVARTDGLACRKIALDDAAQNCARPLVKLLERTLPVEQRCSDDGVVDFHGLKSRNPLFAVKSACPLFGFRVEGGGDFNSFAAIL